MALKKNLLAVVEIRDKSKPTYLASFDELDIVIPYFVAVFVLSDVVDDKSLSPTDCFVTGGWRVQPSVEFRTISETLLRYCDYAGCELDTSEI